MCIHVGWRDLSTDNRSCLCFACFRMSSGHPTIAMSLTVENDFTWQLTAQGHNVDLSTLPSLPTTLMSASEVDEVLEASNFVQRILMKGLYLLLNHGKES